MATNSLTLKEKAYGRWTEIFTHFLNNAKVSAAISANGKHVPSPINPDSKKNGFRFTKDFEYKNGLSFDNSISGGISGVKLISEITGKDTTEVARDIHQYLDGNTNDKTNVQIKQRVANDQHDQKIAEEEKLKFAQRTTNTILSLDTNQKVVNNYLNSRGLSGSIDYINGNAIKGVDSLMFDKTTNLPAIVSQALDNKGNLLFLHRTFLNKNHQKNTALESDKKVTSKIRADAYEKEYHIKVNNAKNSDTVHIAEGIETSLAVSILTKNKNPIFSTINTGGMTKFNPKDGVKHVVIWADNDTNNAGINAANQLKERLIKQGISVDIHLPKTKGHDFLDALNANELDYKVIKNTQEKTVDDVNALLESAAHSELKDTADQVVNNTNEPTINPKKSLIQPKKAGKNGDKEPKQAKEPKFIANNTLNLTNRVKLSVLSNRFTPVVLVSVLSKYSNEQIRHAALITAIKNKNLKTFKVLSLNHNLDIKDSNGNTLINYATDADNVQVLNLLLTKNINIDNQDKTGNTALMSAINNNNTNISKILINAGVDINLTNDYKDSAITLAVKNNNTSGVKALIAAGADPFLQNKDNAIILAARKSKEMLSIFADDSKINSQNKAGETPLILAIKNQESHQTIKRLFNNMSSSAINIQDNNGDTALIKAVQVSDKASINNLLKISNVDLQDNNGNTALMHAVYNQDLKSIDKLISVNANLNLQDNNGDTALIKAVQASNKTTKHIIKAGVDVNQTDNSGDTALIAAARDNNVKAMITLIRNGADTTITNNRNLSASEIAKPFSATYLTLKAHSITKKTINGLSFSIPNKEHKPQQTKLQKAQERYNNNEQTRH